MAIKVSERYSSRFEGGKWTLLAGEKPCVCTQNWPENQIIFIIIQNSVCLFLESNTKDSNMNFETSTLIQESIKFDIPHV